MPASSHMHSTGAVVEAAEHSMPVIADLVNMASAGAPRDIPQAPSTNWINGEVGMDRGRGDLLFDVQLELGMGRLPQFKCTKGMMLQKWLQTLHAGTVCRRMRRDV